MPFVDLLRKNVKSAFDILDDLRTEVTYTQVDVGIYDPATDALTTGEINTTLLAILVTEKVLEQDFTTPKRNTLKALVAFEDLPITPGPNDYFTILGRQWEIVAINQVPGDSVFIFRIREP